MALRSVVAVRDKAAQLFMTPFFVVADGVAVRDFLSEANNPDSVICKHQQDFSLYKLGVFDEGNGTFELYKEPQFMIAAISASPKQEGLL